MRGARSAVCSIVFRTRSNPYIFYKAITLGYQVREVQVTKIYPDAALGYTKMRPAGWWQMLSPLLFLATGLKR